MHSTERRVTSLGEEGLRDEKKFALFNNICCIIAESKVISETLEPHPSAFPGVDADKLGDEAMRLSFNLFSSERESSPGFAGHARSASSVRAASTGAYRGICGPISSSR